MKIYLVLAQRTELFPVGAQETCVAECARESEEVARCAAEMAATAAEGPAELTTAAATAAAAAAATALGGGGGGGGGGGVTPLAEDCGATVDCDADILERVRSPPTVWERMSPAVGFDTAA